MDEVNQTYFPELTETISLENPTKVDPSLILMTKPESRCPKIPLFTHNCQIKTKLSTLILDNGSQENPITTSHPEPYRLGWVQKGGPRITISRYWAVTFVIGPLCDTVTCDISPLDCADLLLGLPYQQERQAMYHAKSH
jgi:hypothetical protein